MVNPLEITAETGRLANLGSLRIFNTPLIERIASDESRGMPPMAKEEFAALVICGLIEEGRLEEGRAASRALKAFREAHSSSA